MGRYSIIVEKSAKKQLTDIYKSGNKVDIRKIEVMFAELEEHLTIGTGSPEQLKYQLAGFWSRRINNKDKLIYRIDNQQIIVVILSAKGHYEDR